MVTERRLVLIPPSTGVEAASHFIKIKLKENLSHRTSTRYLMFMRRVSG